MLQKISTLIAALIFTSAAVFAQGERVEGALEGHWPTVAEKEVSGSAQERAARISTPAIQGKATFACSGGTVVDDGVFENGYTPVSTTFTGGILMRLDPPAGSNTVEQVCICWQRILTDDFIAHTIRLMDDDGPGGSPGTVIADLTTSTDNIPLGLGGTFFSYDLEPLQIPIPPGPIYVGVGGWNSAFNDGVFLCGDETGLPRAPMYFTSTDTAWVDLASQSSAAALGIRADFLQSAACIPGGPTLCLGAGGRFKVTAEWRDFAGNAGVGTIRDIGLQDSGLFWFFGPQNIEILIKVLDACTLNDRFWVFTAATTSVEYTITVEDTATGVTKQYFNPLGNSAAAVTDTDAFATCP